MNMLTKRDVSMDGGLRSFDGLMKAMFEGFPLTPGKFFETPFASKIEVEVKEKEVVATLPMPGCKGSDFKLEVVGNFLTVHASKQEEKKDEDEKKHYIIRERSFSEYEESVNLPVEVEGAKAKAKYADGVLTVTIPREEAKKPRSHSVKVS